MRSHFPFAELLKSRCYRDESGWLVYYKRKSGAVPLLGMIIPKSVFPLAVRRNRLKRLAKAAFYQSHSAQWDILMRASAHAKGTSDVQMKDFLSRLWQFFLKK